MKGRTSTTNGIEVGKSGQQLLLGSGGMRMESIYEMVSVDITKQNSRSSARIWNIMDWTLWKGSPPLKRLKGDSHVHVRMAGTVGAPATIGK
jgi:hypothetical protein